MSRPAQQQQEEEEPEPPHALCMNHGNPVFTCTLGPLPKAQASPLYRTTSSQYGSGAPTFDSAPCVYYPMAQSFSEHLAVCGMPRDTKLNTSLDRSRVYDCPNLHHTI